MLAIFHQERFAARLKVTYGCKGIRCETADHFVLTEGTAASGTDCKVFAVRL